MSLDRLDHRMSKPDRLDQISKPDEGTNPMVVAQ